MPELVIAVVAFVLGYAFRKYTSKAWPTEAALLDAVAKKYGDEAKTRLAKVKAGFAD